MGTDATVLATLMGMPGGEPRPAGRHGMIPMPWTRDGGATGNIRHLKTHFEYLSLVAGRSHSGSLVNPQQKFQKEDRC